MTAVTAKKLLDDAVNAFMDGEDIACSSTRRALVETIVALARYTEEGVKLFPQLFVCEDIRVIAKLVLGDDIHFLGSGALDPQTVRKALKQCAPLAQGAWSIFVERGDSGFTYGLIRLPGMPWSPPPEEGIRGAPTRVLVARQVAYDVVQLYGRSGRTLRVHLNDAPEDEPSPEVQIHDFCAMAVEHVSAQWKEATGRFLVRTIGRALQTGHGSLLAIIRDDHPTPTFLTADDGGVHLDPPVDVAERVAQFTTDKTPEAAFALQGTATFLRGMLDSDGITLLDTKARVRAFRVFVRSGGPGEVAVGGGRRRAFRQLCVVEPKGVVAALCRSQDGGTQLGRGTT